MTAAGGSLPGRTELRREQLARLQQLLENILPANPFYSRKLKKAGFDGKVASLEEFTQRVPRTTKRELVDDQQRNPPYGSNLTYPLSRYARFNQTSGTTSAPMRWLDTPESWGWMLDNWAEVYRAAGVTATDRIFFAFSFGPFLGFWTAFESAARLGNLCIPGGGMRSALRLRCLLETGATVLCCTPTYAICLGEVAAEEGIDLRDTSVRKIIVAGEPGGSIPATRAQILKHWPGARVVDHHGMTEIGPVSYECPERVGVLHVIEPEFIAEIVDPASGQEVPAGTPGELVLTNLGRAGSPLLRYRTGDIVKESRDEPCRCGSSRMALEGGILGRADDMVVVRGVNVYPSAVEQVVRRCYGIAEYRVEIHSERGLPQLRIQIEGSPGGDDMNQLARRLEVDLSNALGLRIPVDSVPHGTLPRFEMKASRWVRV